MAHAVSGGGKPQTPSYKTKGEKLTKALVIEDVKIIEVPREVTVPKFVERKVEQVKYVDVEKSQIKYSTMDKDTIKYNVIEKDTVRYAPKVEETIKYVAKEVEVERPVAVPKEYERPVVKEKIVELVSYQDVAAIKSLMDVIPMVMKEIKALKVELEGLRKYKLVEKVVEVPRLQWVNTPVERIIWKDVERVRP